MKRIILTTVNYDYYNMIKAWLMSMRLHNNDYFIRADFINGNDKIYKCLHNIYPNLEIIHYDIPKEESPAQNLLNLMYTRPPQMMKAIDENWDQIMSMDCDILIRGSLEHIWDNVEPSVIKVKHRKSSTAIGKFQGGVYILGNSPTIKLYYQSIMEKIGKKFAFYDGQAALYLSYINYKEKMKLVELENTYNDLKFGSNSIVWHSRHGHLNDPKFAKYFDKCLLEAKKLEN